MKKGFTLIELLFLFSYPLTLAYQILLILKIHTFIKFDNFIFYIFLFGIFLLICKLFSYVLKYIIFRKVFPNILGISFGVLNIFLLFLLSYYLKNNFFLLIVNIIWTAIFLYFFYDHLKLYKK